VADWKERHRDKICDAASSLRNIHRGMRVFVGSGAAEPQALVRALAARGSELADNQIVHLMTLGVAPYVEPRLEEGFRHNAFFIGANTREAVSQCRADYTPIFLSEIPRLLRSGRLPIDVAAGANKSARQPRLPELGSQRGHLQSGGRVRASRDRAGESPHATRARRRVSVRLAGSPQVHRMVPQHEPLLEGRHPEPDDVEARMNVPGTAEGNWRWRRTPDLLTEPAFRRLRELTENSNRSSLGRGNLVSPGTT